MIFQGYIVYLLRELRYRVPLYRVIYVNQTHERQLTFHHPPLHVW